MYRAEFFSNNFDFQCAHYISEETTISLDYLVMEATTITIAGKTKTTKGSYVHISDINFDGVVSDVQPGRDTVSISIKPLAAVFDVQIFSEVFADVAQFICDAITSNLISNSDSLQNLPVQLTNSAIAASRPLILSESVVRLTDIMATALTTYQIAVDCKLDMNSKTIVAEIKQVSDKKTIEADFDNVIEKEITIGDSYGSYNKAYIRKTSTDNTTGTVSVLDIVPFFLHTDGSVSTQDTDRISPVFWTMDNIENSDDWDRQAIVKATELLAGRKYDNEILLTYHKNDKLVSPQKMQIGSSVVVKTGGKKYISLLTGKTFSAGTIQLIFGAVRGDLTKKLKLDRRNKR